MTTLAELDAYIERLNRHDWSYEYSDDQKVWLKGLGSKAVLEADAGRDHLFNAAYAAYSSWYQAGCGPLEKIFRDAVIGGLRKELKVAATVELIAPGQTKEAA